MISLLLIITPARIPGILPYCCAIALNWNVGLIKRLTSLGISANRWVFFCFWPFTCITQKKNAIITINILISSNFRKDRIISKSGKYKNIFLFIHIDFCLQTYWKLRYCLAFNVGRAAIDWILRTKNSNLVILWNIFATTSIKRFSLIEKVLFLWCWILGACLIFITVFYFVYGEDFNYRCYRQCWFNYP